MRPERPPFFFFFYFVVVGVVAAVFVSHVATTDEAPSPTPRVVEVPRNLRLRLRLIRAARGGAPSIDPEIDAKIVDVMRPLKFDRIRELADERSVPHFYGRSLARFFRDHPLVRFAFM